MGNKQLLDAFFKFEQDNDLFNKVTSNGSYWWDKVRYSVYMEILSEKVRTAKNANHKKKSPNKIKLFLKFGYYLISDIVIFFYYCFNKKKYLFYIRPRERNFSGEFYDKISKCFLDEFNNDSFVVSTMRVKTNKKCLTNTLHIVFDRLYGIFKTSKIELNFELNNLINATFNVNLDFEEIAKKILEKHNSGKFYYHFLFFFLKPKLIFYISTANEKCLLSVANSLDIPTIELQHAQANDFHIAYSYPKGVKYDHLDTFPHTWLTFSDYWHRVNYPVKEKVSVGNDIYRDYSTLPSIKGDNIGVIWAREYMDDLLSVIKKVSKLVNHRKIIIRLHPEQKDEYQYVKESIKNMCNVEICDESVDIKNFLNQTSLIILVQSTVVYEALQMNIMVWVLKVQDYKSQADVFFNRNVHLLDDTTNLKDLVNIERVMENPKYFSAFDNEKFHRVIQKHLLK